VIEPGLGNVVPAIGAKAVFFFVYAHKRRSDAGALSRAPTLGCLRHGLLLQRIHPAEATHRLLIQCHGLLTFGAKRIFAVKFRKGLGQAGAVAFNFSR